MYLGMNRTDVEKEIRFRAGRRGIKELDLLFARFMEQALAGLSERELADFRVLVAQSDLDLFDWLTGQRPLPAEFNTPVYAKLQGLCRFK